MAMSFTNISGTADKYVDIVLPAGFSRATFTCWMYPISVSNYTPILTIRGSSAVNRYTLGLDGTSNKVFLETNSTSYFTYIEASASVTQNTWNMVTGIVNGAFDRTIYLNGAGVQDTAQQSGLTLNRPLLGAYFDNNVTSPTWNGYIAEFAVWATNLNQSEIDSLYKGTKANYIRPTNLRVYVEGIQTANSNRAVTSVTVNGNVPFVSHVRRLG